MIVPPQLNDPRYHMLEIQGLSDVGASDPPTTGDLSNRVLFLPRFRVSIVVPHVSSDFCCNFLRGNSCRVAVRLLMDVTLDESLGFSQQSLRGVEGLSYPVFHWQTLHRLLVGAHWMQASVGKH